MAYSCFVQAARKRAAFLFNGPWIRSRFILGQITKYLIQLHLADDFEKPVRTGRRFTDRVTLTIRDRMGVDSFCEQKRMG